MQTIYQPDNSDPYAGLSSHANSYIKKKIEEGKNYIPLAEHFPSDPSRVTADFLRGISEKLTQRYKKLIFVNIPNFQGDLNVKSQQGEQQTTIQLLRQTKDLVTLLPHEAFRGDILSSLNENFYQYTAIINNERMAKIFTQEPIPIFNEDYEFEALELPLLTRDKLLKGEIPTIENMYLVTKFTEKPIDTTWAKNIKINNIQDLTLVWDFGKDQPIYTDEETYIILANIIYAEEGISSLNLILSGAANAKKTAWLDMIGEITGDKKITSTNATLKGMIPSFFGNTPSHGALLDSHYICPADDFLRFASQQAKGGTSTFTALALYLEQMMNILDRKKGRIPSGKGMYFYHFRQSFFGTDNFALKHEIEALWERDPPVLKRFSWLMLSSETEQRGINALALDEDTVYKKTAQRLEKFNMSFNKYNKMLVMLRKKIPHVKYEENKLLEIISQQPNIKNFIIDHDCFFSMRTEIICSSFYRLA